MIYSKDRYIEGNAYELVRVISEKPFKQEFVRGILLKYSSTELVFLTIEGNIFTTPNCFDQMHQWYPSRALDGSDKSDERFTMYGLSVNTDILEKHLHKDEMYHLSFNADYKIYARCHCFAVYEGYTINNITGWPKLRFERVGERMNISFADVLRNYITINNVNIGDEIRFI